MNVLIAEETSKVYVFSFWAPEGDGPFRAVESHTPAHSNGPEMSAFPVS